jgi:hypothetical protein
MFCHIGESADVIKPAAADDSYCGFAHESAIETNPLRNWKAKCHDLGSKHRIARLSEGS